MKSKVLWAVLVLMLCLSTVAMTSCDVSTAIDHEVLADELVHDEAFVDSMKEAAGATPSIGKNGNWWIGGKDSGVKATAEDGHTPTIGENGNWFFGDTDTGVKATAVGIKSVEINAEGNFILVYTDDTTVDLGKATASACEHAFGDWVIGVAPTCSSIGYNYRTCATCNFVDYAFPEASGHSFDLEPITITQGANKLMIYTCSVCGSPKVEATKAYSEGLEYGLIDDDSHYRVEGVGTCTDVEIIIPDEYEGKPVTEIGEKAFYESEDLVSVTIPESVVKIGDKAFSKCESLEKINMSDTIEVGLDVFRGSINVEITFVHELVHVPAKEATCLEAGNVEYYYCEPCNEYYKDAEGTERLYEVTIAPSHNFVDGVCTECPTVQAEINIVSISTIGNLGKFALGTLENAIGLPTAINVMTEDGLTHTLPIDWDMSDYVKSEVGEYTIEGYIQLGKYHLDTGLTNRVEATIEIVETMEGTADVVFILDVSGSMSDEIANVKNNIVAFAQALEAQGVSARWSAITYSDYTEYPSTNREEQTQIIMNGAEQWFVSAEDYKYAIGNIDLAVGGDFPEVAVDGLMMATTLTTRADARVFYILLTDATYKADNHYSVSDMEEAVEILDGKGVNVSVITDSSYAGNYNNLYTTTGGIYSDIYGDFSSDLLESLVPIIYEEVVE